jgi:hypothetical protein
VVAARYGWVESEKWKGERLRIVLGTFTGTTVAALKEFTEGKLGLTILSGKLSAKDSGGLCRQSGLGGCAWAT